MKKALKFVVLLLSFDCYRMREVMLLLVLIIDPDMKYLERTEAIFQKQGMQVAAFSDPMAAVKYGFNNDVDSVYTEVIMPHLTGFDVVRLLRKRHADIGAYVLTDSDQFLMLAKENGLDGYYKKPMGLNDKACNLLELSAKY